MDLKIEKGNENKTETTIVPIRNQKFSVTNPIGIFQTSIFELLFKKFEINEILSIFSSILMERRVLFLSRKIGVLSNSIQAFIYLLHPFIWQHVLIPIVPEYVINATLAPMPYILGVLTCFRNQINVKELEEIIAIDLDKSLIVNPHQDLDFLPSGKCSNLTNKIKKIIEDWENMNYLNIEKLFSAFLDFFSRIFENYSKFLNFEKLDGNFNFDYDGFLKSSSKENRKFLLQFSKTQMFQMWIQSRKTTMEKGEDLNQNLAKFEMKLIERAENKLNSSASRFLSNLFSKNSQSQKKNNEDLRLENERKDGSMKTLPFKKKAKNNASNRKTIGNIEIDQNKSTNDDSFTENDIIVDNDNVQNKILIKNRNINKNKKANKKILDLLENVEEHPILEVLNEMLLEEQDFYSNLQIIKIEFYEEIEKQQLISTDLIKSLFGNILVMLEIQKVILDSLEKWIENWDKESIISEHFEKIAPYLRIYGTYISGYELMKQGLDKASNNSQFKNFILIKKKEYKGNDLERFLVLPISHFKKYLDSLKLILKYTKKENNDYTNLITVNKKFHKLNDLMKDKLKEIDEHTKILEIQNQFSNKINLVSPNRKFIFSEQMRKVCEKKPVKKKFYLFTDIILYSGLFPFNHNSPQIMEIKGMEVKEVDDEQYPDNSFLIQTPKESFVIVAESQESKDKWVTLINEQIANLLQKKKTLKTEDEDDQANLKHAAIWIPDNRVKQCMKCKKKFTTIRRRHHCRNCGKIFCGKCTEKRILLEQISDKLSRVCHDCYTQLNDL